MSRLYASIDSDARRTPATSRGHRNMSAHVRGWGIGVEVRAHAEESGGESFDLYITSGSNGGTSPRLIGTVRSSGVFEEVHPKAVV